MSQEPGAISKISNPQSIARLVARMCDGKMQVLLKQRDSGKVTIRATITKIGKFKQNNALLLDRISEAGLGKLDLGMPLRIEVLGMSSQLTFQAVILDKTPTGIVCSMPAALLSTERRINSRFRVTQNVAAFMSFDFWKAQQADPASPPFFSNFGGIASWIAISDISLGGVCLVVRFPSFINAAEKITESVECNLHLPMSPPMPMNGIIRWRRKIKNRTEVESIERFQLEYRIGFEFAGANEDQNQKIRHFIRQLTVAEAI